MMPTAKSENAQIMSPDRIPPNEAAIQYNMIYILRSIPKPIGVLFFFFMIRLMYHTPSNP